MPSDYLPNSKRGTHVLRACEQAMHYHDMFWEAFILLLFLFLLLFTTSKTIVSASNPSTSKTTTGTTEEITVLCALVISEGGLVSVVGEMDGRNGLESFAGPDELKVSVLVGTVATVDC